MLKKLKMAVNIICQDGPSPSLPKLFALVPFPYSSASLVGFYYSQVLELEATSLGKPRKRVSLPTDTRLSHHQGSIAPSPHSL